MTRSTPEHVESGDEPRTRRDRTARDDDRVGVHAPDVVASTAEPAAASPFAALGLTYDDVLLQPGETDVIPSEVDTTTRLTREISIRVAAHLGRHGHRHRGPDGDRHGPARRHRHPAPQPVDRGPGLPGRPRQAHPDRHDLQPGHHRPRRHPRGPRRDLRPSTASRGCRSSTTATTCSASSPTATCASRRSPSGPHPGARRHDPDAAHHRRTSASATTRPRCCCASTSASACRSSTTQGRLSGLITVKDFVKSEQFPDASKDADGRLLVGAAVGYFGEAWQRATTLIEAGRRRARRRHRPRPRAPAARDGRAGQEGPRHPARPGHRRQRRHPRRGPGARRRRCRRRQGRRRAGLDLHHPRRGRRRRPAGHRRSTRPRWRAAPPASRSSATAACSTPATSPRPSSPAPTPSWSARCWPAARSRPASWSSSTASSSRPTGAWARSAR